MTVALVQRLIEAGTPAALVAEVAMELARAQAERDQLEARRSADRQRKARQRPVKSREVTGQNGTGRDPAPKKVSPEPPSKNNPTLETPNGVSTAAPSSDPFEEFWRAYPRREGENPKKPAKLSFERACRKGADPQRIIAAARVLASKHPVPTAFVPQAVTWLNQERWNDAESTGPPEVRPIRTVEEVIAERLAQNAAARTG
jgi:hypothetical protein